MTSPFSYDYDVLIIGSGAAGLGLALSLIDSARIAILSKENTTTGSSLLAQGGIAAVMSKEDSLDAHIQDTLNTGIDLCNRDVVIHTVKQAYSAIQWLIQHGVQFTQNTHNTYHLTQEGGHSHRRILHAADKTGAVIVNTLSEQVRQQPHIHCLTHHVAIDLIVHNQQCYGAYVFDDRTQQSYPITARYTVLATGGASSVYLRTSNPVGTTGDGIAMSWRAGCRVANLEFHQFHPTCLFHAKAPAFLITEVVRGEGGRLLLPNGEPFMHHYDSRAEMAPRDIVTRAIVTELEKNHLSHVHLDISHRPADFIQQFFPTIYQQCLAFGIDITQEPIPVTPAAHYTCGGVMTTIQGQTDLNNLYAIGEVAHTGLHGANRIASNSLLECLVFATNASQAIKERLLSAPSFAGNYFPEYSHPGKGKKADIAAINRQIEETMWHHVGIIRNQASLEQAYRLLKALKAEADVLFSHTALNKSLIELRNKAQMALLITTCALSRKESRGLHYNVDYPKLNPHPQHTILIPQTP